MSRVVLIGGVATALAFWAWSRWQDRENNKEHGHSAAGEPLASGSLAPRNKAQGTASPAAEAAKEDMHDTQAAQCIAPPPQVETEVVIEPATTPSAPTPVEDAKKVLQLVALAGKKKQSGNEALAGGKHREALELFDGALKALQYVVPTNAHATCSNDSQYLAAVVDARQLQGACALNGALVCLKLHEWDRAKNLACLALDLEKCRSEGEGDGGLGGDPVRIGKALYRRAVAFSELGAISEALADLRSASTRGGLGNDVGVLELLARVACCSATSLLKAKQVAAAYIYKDVFICIYVFEYTYIHLRIHMYIYTYIYLYVYVYVSM